VVEEGAPREPDIVAELVDGEAVQPALDRELARPAGELGAPLATWWARVVVALSVMECILARDALIPLRAAEET